jgi:hypothetical protein
MIGHARQERRRPEKGDVGVLFIDEAYYLFRIENERDDGQCRSRLIPDQGEPAR